MNRTWLSTLARAAAVCLAGTLSSSAGTLIDVAFGGSVTSMTGLAAIGQTTNDFWNSYVLGSVSLSNLEFADRTPSGAELTVGGVVGSYANPLSDVMLANDIFNNGGDITVTASNLTAGVYDVYLCGHGNTDEMNSMFQLSAGPESYGLEATTTNANWNSSL